MRLMRTYSSLRRVASVRAGACFKTAPDAHRVGSASCCCQSGRLPQLNEIIRGADGTRKRVRRAAYLAERHCQAIERLLTAHGREKSVARKVEVPKRSLQGCYSVILLCPSDARPSAGKMLRAIVGPLQGPREVLWHDHLPPGRERRSRPGAGLQRG